METLKIPKDFQNLQMCTFRGWYPQGWSACSEDIYLNTPLDITFTLCGRKPLNSLDINF